MYRLLLSNLKHILLYLLLFACSTVKGGVIYAPGTMYLPDNAISLDDGYQLTLQGVFGGMTLIVLALLLWFRGSWDTTAAGFNTQKLTGFIVLGFVTWIMLANFEPQQTYGTNRLTIYYIVPFSIGFLALFLMSHTIHLYQMMLGALGGLSLGLWILGWKTDLVITTAWGRAVLLTVLAVVFMWLGPKAPECHILGVALSGAYMLFMGLDIFIHTGFLYVFTTSMDSNSNHAHRYETNRSVFIMQACLIIGFIVGYIAQIPGMRNIAIQHDFLINMAISKENESKYMVVDFNRFRGMHFFGHPHQGPPAGPPPVVAPVQPNPVDPIV